MSVSELYEYWHVALRIGTESFIVRRTQQRLKADEITVREATEGLRSYEVVAISRFGSLEECARRTQTGVCDITPSEPGECNLALWRFARSGPYGLPVSFRVSEALLR